MSYSSAQVELQVLRNKRIASWYRNDLGCNQLSHVITLYCKSTICYKALMGISALHTTKRQCRAAFLYLRNAEFELITSAGTPP